jgi:hypothetical protein
VIETVEFVGEAGVGIALFAEALLVRLEGLQCKQFLAVHMLFEFNNPSALNLKNIPSADYQK